MNKIFNLFCAAMIMWCTSITGTYVVKDYQSRVNQMEQGTGKVSSSISAESRGEENKEGEKISLPGITAEGAILVDAATGKVLYEFNADRQLMPASTTKIMTALVCLEICKELGIDMDSEIIVPKNAEGIEGSSIYLKAGERVTIEKLLYGLMLQSGNDAATALATCLGGNEENFIEKMNQKADDLNCENTNFVNPSGLTAQNHYTSAKDLALITCEVMKNENFRKIVGAKEWENYTNKNKTVHYYDGGNGVKIGYTKASGRTLVASATRGEVTLIAVVLNDGNWFNDAYNLLDYGFNIIEGGSNEL